MSQHTFSQLENTVSRRRFLGSAAATSAVAGAFALTGCSSSRSVTPPTNSNPPSVADVLNFALNLEYLEATFYAFVATGADIDATNLGAMPGTVTGGATAAVAFTNPQVAAAAQQLASDELQHVQLLRSVIPTLGGTPVDRPALNLAAMGMVTSDATFLSIARQLEAVGVSAYAGSAQYLVSQTAVLTNAAQILHVESQHEAFLRQLCIVLNDASPAVDSMDVAPVLAAPFNTSTSTGLVAERTTSQVLSIVYGSAGTTGLAKGGFFPNGLNGKIIVS